MPMTKLDNLVNPQVMAQMVSASLPKKIKFSPIAKIDTTLEGRPGNTITIPKYAYIGDAEDRQEGVPMDTSLLTASTTEVTIKSAGKAVEITDESVLSGYGDPMGEAVTQIGLSLAAKVDNDCLSALYTAPLSYNGTDAQINYDNIVKADAVFGDESDAVPEKVLYINPAQEQTIRLDPNFMDKNKYGLEVVMNGAIGKIAGAEVKKSKKVRLIKYEPDESGSITVVADSEEESDTNLHADTVQSGCLKAVKVGDKVNTVATPYYACPLVVLSSADPDEDPEADATDTTTPALTIYMKRSVQLETDRDILKKTTVASADEHYVAALTNDSKVVIAKFKA